MFVIERKNTSGFIFCFLFYYLHHVVLHLTEGVDDITLDEDRYVEQK